MPDPFSPDLLARFLAGEATPAERAQVEAWAAAEPDHRAELERLQAAWRPSPRAEWDVDRAWARVSPRLDENASVSLSRWRMASPGRTWRLALAASVLVILGAAFVWRVLSPDGAAVPQVLATLPGQQQAIELADGTRITLAAGSELRVSAEYGRRVRQVELEGEAWFEVVHDTERPFLVHAAGVVTEDLGTEFTVRARPEEGFVRVVVVSGSASLRRADAPPSEAAILRPRDVGTFANGAVRPTVERLADVARLVDWHEGRLVFEDAELDSVARELSRWYGQTFVIENLEFSRRRITGTFRHGELQDALDVLGLTLGAQIEPRADTVVIR